MKKFISFLILLLICSSVNAQWKLTSAPIGVSYSSMVEKQNKIFAVAGNNGIIVSSDDGISWQAANSGLTNLNIGILSVGRSGNIYACGTNAVFVSADQGQNWTSLKNNLPDATYFRLIETGSKLFVSSNSGLFRSSDNGQIWEKIQGLQSPSVRGVTEKDGFLFAGLSGAGPGTSHGIYRSADLGNTWEANNNGITTDVTDFEILKNRLYASEVTILAYSTNLGTNWNNIMSGLGSGLYVLDLCTSGDYIFAAQILSGAFVQHKDSTTWRPIHQGITSNMVQCIASNNKYCFAGSASNGIFRRPLSEMIFTGIENNPESLQNESLLKISPNPVFGYTKISYRVKNAGIVTISLTDITGKTFKVLEKDWKPAGMHDISFNASSIPKGVYLCRYQSDEGIDVSKLVNQSWNH